jgi:hypothetical protein
MSTLSALLFDNGLPDLPVLLIEPHRNRHGIWRIKFCYDDAEPLSMNAEQASEMALKLRQIDQEDFACEVEEAVERAIHYASM